jgi:hypothetical protein
MAQLVDARFARGWRGEGRSRATEVRAEGPRFAVLLEHAQVPRQRWAGRTTRLTLKGRATDTDRATHD